MRNKTVLIADNDGEIRRTLAEALLDDGYHVDTAVLAGEVIQKVQNTNIDVLIMDVEISDMKGYEIVPIIKKIDHTLPIIMTSEDSSLELAKKIRKEGIFYYAMKPLDLDEIRMAVKDATRKQVRETRRNTHFLKIRNTI